MRPFSHCDLPPGGLLGFSSFSLCGALINLGTWGLPFFGLSHVAIVARHPGLDTPLLWESTSRCDLPCAIRGKRVSGVQAHWIAERIGGYRGKVWYYPLRPGLSGDQNADLTDFLDRRLGTDYDYLGALRARDATFIEKLLGKENLHTLFCSELVATAWNEIGVWHTPNASRWSPNRLARTAVDVGIVGKPRRIRVVDGRLVVA